MTTIRKALISEFGDVSKVSVVTSTIEDPPAKHAQVRVLYCSFTGADTNMRLGRYPLQKAAPLTPGYCFVGTVSKIGPKCESTLRVGDMVACMSVYDGESELVNQPEKYLIPVPAGMDLQKTCALILDWTTAYGMVFRTGKVHAGQKVFVHGMSGAVGYAISTLCKLQGAEVYGTASARSHEGLRALGWHPFVYTDKNWMTEMKKLGGADVAFDPLGFESWDESYDILSHNDACLIGYGTNLAAMQDTPARGSVMTTLKLLSRNFMCPAVHRHTRFFYVSRDDKTFVPELQALMDLLRQGKIDVKIKAIFDLENIRDAHNAWSGGMPGFGSMLINVGAK
jgi:synaptic vesicle membrane protein VAT-1